MSVYDLNMHTHQTTIKWVDGYYVVSCTCGMTTPSSVEITTLEAARSLAYYHEAGIYAND